MNSELDDQAVMQKKLTVVRDTVASEMRLLSV